MAEVHEIADGVYRIATFNPDIPLVFTQFLIVDETPLLFHTGQRSIFPQTLEAVKKVIDPAKLRYISYSHLEADECGAMNEFLQVAPEAEVVHGQVSALIGQGEFFTRPMKVIGDNEVLDMGQKKLRFLITPHVPHAWDAILVFEDTTRTLFCSDLFTAFGKPAPVTDSDIIEPAMEVLKQLPDYLPIGPHTARVFDRLEALQPRVLAGHHAPAYTGDAVQALRDLRTQLMASVGQ